MASDLDNLYGAMRMPHGPKPWELEMMPRSKSVLSTAVSTALRMHSVACQETLLRYSSKWITYLWVVDKEGTFHIAVEELAVMLEPSNLSGAPRLKRHHPAETKKLGHPSLLLGGEARIAGELFLDEVSGVLCWYVNCDSGRYCKRIQPTFEQKNNILLHFRSLLGAELQLDEIEGKT